MLVVSFYVHAIGAICIEIFPWCTCWPFSAGPMRKRWTFNCPIVLWIARRAQLIWAWTIFEPFALISCVTRDLWADFGWVVMNANLVSQFTELGPAWVAISAFVPVRIISTVIGSWGSIALLCLVVIFFGSNQIL